MTDEIVGGVGAPPRRRSRAALVVSAAVLFGYVLTHRYPSPPTEAVPAPQPPPASRSLLAEPQLVGRTGPGPAGLRLLVDGTDPRIIDAHTLAVTPVPGLNLQPGSTAQLLMTGSSVIAALTRLYGPNGGVYLIKPGAKPMLLAAEGLVVPSHDGGIIVAVYRSGQTSVTGLALDRRVRWRWRLPGNGLLLRDTPAGLVVAQYADAVSGHAELLLVDQRTGGVVRRLGHGRQAVAVSDRLLAWEPVRCAGGGCSLVVTELSTGGSRRYDIYRRPALASGAFSPDGRRLALSFAGVPGDSAGPQEAGSVAILDLRTGRKAYVPGLTTPNAEHADVAWSADGQWLVLGVKYPDQERIAVWRPGQDVLILSTVLPGQPTTATLSVLS